MHAASLPYALSLLFTLSVLPAQERTETKVELLGGSVTVDYTSTKLSGRSPESLPVGGVWRMSKDVAATLTTTVALQSRNLTLPPGKYRLSARRTGMSKWSLLAFEDGMVFQPGTLHHETALRLGKEDESREDLNIRLRSSRSSVRFKLHWGKFSMNMRFKALKTHRVAARLGGKPAEITLYALPVAQTQPVFSGGSALTVGEARLLNSNAIRYRVEAKRDGNGANLVFTNASTAPMQKAMKVLRAQEASILKQNAGTAESRERRAARVTARIKALDAKMKTAKDLAATVTVPAKVANAAATAKVLEAKGRQTPQSLLLTLTFGAKDATFEIRDASFKRAL